MQLPELKGLIFTFAALFTFCPEGGARGTWRGYCKTLGTCIKNHKGLNFKVVSCNIRGSQWVKVHEMIRHWFRSRFHSNLSDVNSSFVSASESESYRALFFLGAVC